MSRHSNDLRQRALDFFKSNKSKTTTAKTFQISRDTLDSWINLDEKGLLHEVRTGGKGVASKVDLKKLEEYVDNNPDKYYREIAKEFGIKKSQAQRLVTNKLGYTSKKNRKSIVKQMKV
jgi:transposase